MVNCYRICIEDFAKHLKILLRILQRYPKRMSTWPIGSTRLYRIQMDFQTKRYFLSVSSSDSFLIDEICMKQAAVSSLVAKLQLYVQQVNSALEDTSQQVLAGMPRIVKDAQVILQFAEKVLRFLTLSILQRSRICTPRRIN